MNNWLELGLSNALAASGLAVGALLVTRLCRRPQLSYAAWLLVLAKLIVPPLVALPLPTWRSAPAQITNATAPPSRLQVSPDEEPLPSWPEHRESEVNVAAASEFVGFSAAHEISDPSWLPESADFAVAEGIADIPSETVSPLDWFRSHATQLVGGLWLTGSLIWFITTALRMLRFNRLLCRAELAPPSLQAELAHVAKVFDLAHAPELRIINRRVPPLVWALFGRATLLVPAELLQRLSYEERTTLFAHELAHIERRDYSTRWLELLALGVYWWYPVAWWARRNAARAEEDCCDARVVDLFPDLARSYAGTLLAAAEFLAPPAPPLPLGASGFSQARLLKRRMEMILSQRVSSHASRRLRAAILITGLSVLPLSLRALWAEPAAAPATVETPATIDAPAAQPAPAASPSVEGTVEPISPHQPTAPVAPVAVPAKPVTVAVPAKPAVPVISATPAVPDRYEPTKHKPRTWRMSVPTLSTTETYAAPQAAPAAPASGVEERLDRLERMLEQLLKQGQGRPMSTSRSGTVKDFESAVEREKWFVKLQRAAAFREAVARQAEAVCTAFDAGTITFDQVLEAKRRQLKAETAYASLAADVYSAQGPLHDYTLAVYQLAALDRALDDARQLWKSTHSNVSGEPLESQLEAQAREQYFALKKEQGEAATHFARAQQELFGKARAKKATTADDEDRDSLPRDE